MNHKMPRHKDEFLNGEMEINIVGFLIEHGNHGDLDEMEMLYNDVNETLEQQINYPGWKKGIYPIREDAAEGINEHNLFVARIDNKIAGSIILNHKPDHAYQGVKWQYDGDYSSIFVVHTFAVHPAFAKSGIGRRLMDFAQSYGVQNNIKAIRLDVYENNIPAIKLYESCGYEYISTVDLGLKSYGLDWFQLYEKLLHPVPQNLVLEKSGSILTKNLQTHFKMTGVHYAK